MEDNDKNESQMGVKDEISNSNIDYNLTEQDTKRKYKSNQCMC